MSSLSSKSAQELTDLLDGYGIKHGPVVDSTRSLYERKLKEVMAKGKRVKPSSDQTYYREEGNIYILIQYTHNQQVNEAWVPVNEMKYCEVVVSSYLKATPQKVVPEAPQTPKSSRLIPLWVQFVFFLAVAVFLYIVFSSMEMNEPLKGIK
uniref:LEM domain-containing protein n=1 Tax=Labrus bergylta TaxID=56723 RepID=A0A3Q3G1F3_9LABR